MTKNPSSDATLPKGIHRSWKLPDKSLGDLWDSIVMDEAIKKQLLSQAIVNFTVRPKVERRHCSGRVLALSMRNATNLGFQ